MCHTKAESLKETMEMRKKAYETSCEGSYTKRATDTGTNGPRIMRGSGGIFSWSRGHVTCFITKYCSSIVVVFLSWQECTFPRWHAPHLQGMRDLWVVCYSLHRHQTSMQLNTDWRFWANTLHSSLCTNTNWGKILWINVVNSSNSSKDKKGFCFVFPFMCHLCYTS